MASHGQLMKKRGTTSYAGVSSKLLNILLPDRQEMLVQLVMQVIAQNCLILQPEYYDRREMLKRDFPFVFLVVSWSFVPFLRERERD